MQMQIESPMSNLRDVLAKVKETATTYHPQFSGNEAATRLALIDPVLNALGWSMSNPLMVVVENTAPSVRADYVLYDSGRSPRIIIEAKSLGVNVSTKTSQLFAAAGRIQVNQAKTGFITNGTVWEHYKHPQALTNRALIWKEDTTSSDLQSMAAHLIEHLDVAQFWPQEEDTTAPEILRLQQDFTALEKRIVALEGGLSPSPPPLASVPKSTWVELDKLPPDMAKTRPAELRFPDGTERPVKSWRQAVLVACEMALNSNPGMALPLRDKAGNSINLIGNVQIPRSVQIITAIGNSVFAYPHYDADGCIANIKHILSQMPAGKQSVKPAVIYAPI